MTQQLRQLRARVESAAFRRFLVWRRRYKLAAAVARRVIAWREAARRSRAVT